MKRLALPLFACLLLAAPVQADDLTGLWTVEGALPNGTTYRGHAAISKVGSSYRIVGRGKLSTQRSLTWRALGRRNGNQLNVRHYGKRGLIGRILGPLDGDPPALTGRYKIESDGSAFGGRYRIEGTAKSGSVVYTRAELPRVTFEPAELTLRSGERAELVLDSAPTESLRLMRVVGKEVTRHFWEQGKRKIEIEGKIPGQRTLKVRLGSRGGAIVKEFRLTVLPKLLDSIVERVEKLVAEGKKPIVIFDLDDTLFDTRYRVRSILRDYGAEIDDERLKKLSVRHVRYLLPETLKNAGLSEAEIAGQLGKNIKRAWSRRFFNGDSFHLDRTLRGAVKYVERLEKAGAKIVYVTGRKEKTRDACLEVLAESGYPAENLFCKPNPVPGQPKLSTEEFKEQVTKDTIAPTGVVVAAFDNEPGNCNAFHEATPDDTTIVWLDTLYKPGHPELHESVERITDFR